MKLNILNNFKITKLILIKEQLFTDLSNNICYSTNLDTWFYYEMYTPYIWSPIARDKLIGIIQDKYILPNISYIEKNSIKSLTNYSFARGLEKELRLQCKGFKENNDLFIGNNKLYSFHNSEIVNIPKNIKELNIINYLPYSLEFVNIKDEK